MSPARRIVDVAMDHSRIAILLMVVLTAAVGAGATQVSESSGLDQFRTESEVSQKLDYIEANFTTGEANTTTVQVVVRGRGRNVLSKGSLVSILEFERALRDNRTVNATLASESPIVGVPNVIATAAIARERARALQERAAELQRRQAALQRDRAALQERRRTLNATADALRAALTDLGRDPTASVDAAFDRVRANTTVELGPDDRRTFRRAATALRNARNESARAEAYRLGTRGVLQDEYAALRERGSELRSRAEELRALGEEVQSARADLEDGVSPTLAEQIAQIESMNETAIDRTVERVLSAEGAGDRRVFRLMPTGYEPGSTRASATMLFVTQRTDESTSVQGSAPDRIVDSQLAMRDIGQARDPLDYQVFGSGVVAHEIDASMEDSLVIVGPLALLFVIVALVVAYRDFFDIVLGLLGIGAVLAWTFGFMGWAGIDFNQIFVAVPVLLIGLSIDYAIHIFMRHREEREVVGDGSRGSMRVALAGVGVALTWVTATTVIGFLSNLVSPVPPIREFGLVSAFGIAAALLVFGVLVPAIKVELDEFLEGLGLDRKKRAFGTGGGRFSDVLAVGATLARKTPYVVILLTLLVTAVSAYGGAQVDTSFQQEDFLAEDPPDWMKDLPEPFAPSEYTVKRNLEYVNENFFRETEQAQILVEGSVTNSGTLERIATASDRVARKGVTRELPTGEADVTSPLSVMRRVAARNATFNATYRAADGPDANSVPDRNLGEVYDTLYAVAPDEARRVLYRGPDGEYRALRLVVAIEGGASGDAITTQMRDVADFLDTPTLDATATGRAILNQVVQQELLDTVIQSLLITLVAIFVFLAAAYRLTEGSATLGIVTLVPVALTVAWILGTMFLLGVPFNVLTGTITSLTVGLGVAYGIHVSERYNQELERNGSIHDAMRTTVTGTGGALLGSAATTVGGFGVLVFAILPPLQQFGLITGITIVYAFLASVIVLPSLLVVWTRLVEPEAALPLEADSAAPDLAAVEGEAPGPTPAANPGDDTDGIDSTPADADATGPRIDRTVEYDHVRPGQTVDVTVAVRGLDGRVVLEDAVAGGAPALETADPEPVDALVAGESVYAAWELDPGETASLTYAVAVPEDAPDGDEITFAGRVLSAAGERPIAGDGATTVVADLFERVLTRGEVTADDLRIAGEQRAAGELTDRQLERVHREWLAGDDELAEWEGSDE